MSIHYHRELERLRKSVLAEGARVEDMLVRAIRALMERDLALAEDTMSRDNDIDRMEIDVEEDCLKILALHQPVAQDLRFIVTVLKMNNDLERMADIAANIAKRARYLAKREPLGWPEEIEALAINTKAMVKQSLDSLIQSDVELAREVCAADATVNRQKSRIIEQIRERMKAEPQNIETLLKMIDVPRHLERIADLSTNIAEDVAYMVEGRIIRHSRLNDDENS